MILSETTFALGLLVSSISAGLVGAIRDRCVVVRASSVVGLVVRNWCGDRMLCPPELAPDSPPLAAAWLVVASLYRRGQSRQAVWRSPAVVAVFGLLLGLVMGSTPWTWCNDVVTGHIVPTTLWMGPSLYDGLNPDANGDSHMEFLQHDALYQTLSEYEVDLHYRREAWNRNSPKSRSSHRTRLGKVGAILGNCGPTRLSLITGWCDWCCWPICCRCWLSPSGVFMSDDLCCHQNAFCGVGS